MKITRRQLRRLITEMARTPIEDPRKDLDLSPEHMQKLQTLYDSGDEATIATADSIAHAAGGDPYHSKVMARYGVESIMNEFEFAEPYLTPGQFEELMLAKGKELQLGSNQFGMLGFQEAGAPPQINFVVDPISLHLMIEQVAAKRPEKGAPFGGPVHVPEMDKIKQSTSDHINTYPDYYSTLLKFFEAIIKISKVTYIHQVNIARYGMGTSPFSELEKAGKLVLGFAPDEGVIK